MTRRAAIVAGNRTPFVRAGRRYAQVSAQDLLVAALDGLVARCGLAGERLGEVVAGAVLKHSRDLNLTREAVLSTALDAATPAYDVQQACATGLETAVLLANKIALGQVESGIAGGADSASDAPIALDDRLRRVLLDLSRARTPAARLAALSRLRPGQLRPVPPRNAEPRTGLSMGEHAARTAAAWEVSRQAQDELALASHRNLAAAYERGFLDDLLTPYLGVRRDDLLRPDTSLEKLAALPPVFGRDLEQPATMTAGNSTPLTDGAAVVLLASDEWAAQHRLPVLAHLVDAETAAVDHVHGEGLLTAPVWAVPRLLQRNGLTLDDLDVVEVHEAFASTVLATLAAWEDEEFCRDRLGLEKPLGSVDRARLNPVGSSLATGHPFAATGARILATTAKLLAERGGGRALISICAAGGQGIAALVEA
ncbi:acetyl-CoA C-acetyltransferase [Kineococcus sp. T13]|uniref:acetyl-CoA C-acetyltransferase n=1 Tax=Kineococcus vitellinus TaxID=2696565 RepID=UPI001412F736|nr:acetyl-CoA C-acetyltransferase [Kineococcus vitellinus]